MMDQKLRNAIFSAVEKEPFAKLMHMKLVELKPGFSMVEMKYDPSKMDNLFARAHGGALFALIDQAFETACQTEGAAALALNVNVTYVSSPQAGTKLRAEAKMLSQTKKTLCYDIKVTEENGNLIATCSGLAYRSGKPLPFL